MIDIHSHILPGVDDGASNLDETVGMLASALESGVTDIVATPHIHDWLDENYLDRIKASFKSVKTEIQQKKIHINLIQGAEILITHDLAEMVGKYPEFSIGGHKKYVLVELPFMEIPIYFENVMFQLKTTGITPVIAHVERYFEIIKKPERIDKIIQSGAVIQSNIGSFSGRYGKKVKKTAVKLLKNKKIHLLASDRHGLPKQGGYLNVKDLAVIKKIVSKSEFESLLKWEPGKVIEDKIHARY